MSHPMSSTGGCSNFFTTTLPLAFGQTASAHSLYKWSIALQIGFNASLFFVALSATTDCVPDHCAPAYWDPRAPLPKCVPAEHKVLTLTSALFASLPVLEVIWWKVYTGMVGRATAYWKSTFAQKSNGATGGANTLVEYRLVQRDVSETAVAVATGATDKAESVRWLHIESVVRTGAWLNVVSVPLLLFVYVYVRPDKRLFHCASSDAMLWLARSGAGATMLCLAIWVVVLLRGSEQKRRSKGASPLSRGSTAAAWNSKSWCCNGCLEPHWVLFFAAASLFFSIGVMVSVWSAYRCFPQTAAPEEKNGIREHFDSCFVTSGDENGDPCDIRCTSTPGRLGVTATLISATVTSIILTLMRLRAYWVRGHTAVVELYVEHVLAPDALADNSQAGRERLAAARHVAKLVTELHKASENGEASEWLVEQVVKQCTRMMKHLFGKTVGSILEWERAGQTGLSARTLMQQLRSAMMAQDGADAVEQVCDRLLQDGQVVLTPNLQDQLRADLASLFTTAAVPNCPSSAQDAALLVCLYMLCCQQARGDIAVARHLLVNIFGMLNDWKPEELDCDHDHLLEHRAAYFACSMMRVSQLQLQHSQGLREAISLLRNQKGADVSISLLKLLLLSKTGIEAAMPVPKKTDGSEVTTKLVSVFKRVPNVFTGDALFASILYCLLNAHTIEVWLHRLASHDAQGLGEKLAKLQSDHVQLAHKEVAIQEVQTEWVGAIPLTPSASTEYPGVIHRVLKKLFSNLKRRIPSSVAQGKITLHKVVMNGNVNSIQSPLATHVSKGSVLVAVLSRTDAADENRTTAHNRADADMLVYGPHNATKRAVGRPVSFCSPSDRCDIPATLTGAAANGGHVAPVLELQSYVMIVHQTGLPDSFEATFCARGDPKSAWQCTTVVRAAGAAGAADGDSLARAEAPRSQSHLKTAASTASSDLEHVLMVVYAPKQA